MKCIRCDHLTKQGHPEHAREGLGLCRELSKARGHAVFVAFGGDPDCGKGKEASDADAREAWFVKRTGK